MFLLVIIACNGPCSMDTLRPLSVADVPTLVACEQIAGGFVERWAQEFPGAFVAYHCIPTGAEPI